MILGLDHNEAIVLAGTSLLGAASGTIGSFAVLRRRALLGDALSHATLPGVAAAFLLTGQRSLPLLLVGALVAAMLGIFALAWIRRRTRLRDDAGIALVLGVFFGVGIVLFSEVQNQATGAQAGLNLFLFGQAAGMVQSDVVILGAFAAAVVAVVFLFFKEFALVTFDHGFAEVQGWPARGLDVTLLILLAGAAVLGLPSVGAVLMAAMLIIPSGAARFWTDSLPRMTILSAAFGIIAASGGTLLSGRWSWPTGPTIILVASSLFILSLLFAPKRGWVSRIHRALAVMIDRSMQRLLVSLAEGKRRPESWPLVLLAQIQGLTIRLGGKLELTDEGRELAETFAENRRRWIAAVEANPDLARTESAFDLTVDPEELAT